MAVEKNPGDSFGAGLVFEHLGPSETVWVGIGLAYTSGMLEGHNTPFCYAMQELEVNDDTSWTEYRVVVEGTIPEDATPGVSLDAQRFISKTQPVVGEQPPNDFDQNAWTDGVYNAQGTGGGFDLGSMMGLMMVMMMMGTIAPMLEGGESW